MYLLSRQGHCRVATSGRDKRWKHISAKPTTRWDFFKGSWKITTLIGYKCKCSNVCSWVVLITHRLMYSLPLLVGGKRNSLMNLWYDFTNMLTYTVEIYWNDLRWLSQWGSPLTIPNREVKPISADGTATGGRVGRCLSFKPQSFIRLRFFFALFLEYYRGLLNRK